MLNAALWSDGKDVTAVSIGGKISFRGRAAALLIRSAQGMAAKLRLHFHAIGLDHQR
jgi:hypothetical protein